MCKSGYGSPGWRWAPLVAALALVAAPASASPRPSELPAPDPAREQRRHELLEPDEVSNTRAYLSALIPRGVTETDYLTGRFDPAEVSGFEPISRGSHGHRVHFLRSEVATSFRRMAALARLDGISLTILSSFRSRDDQAHIFSRKTRAHEGEVQRPLDRVQVARALRYTALPGASRHHWGTDVDVNSVAPSYFRSGRGAKELAWLERNAGSFGFVPSYSPGRARGHNDEPWHWSYAPVAIPLLEEYNQFITVDDLQGTPGAQYAFELKLFENYVNGVDPRLRPASYAARSAEADASASPAERPGPSDEPELLPPDDPELLPPRM